MRRTLFDLATASQLDVNRQSSAPSNTLNYARPLATTSGVAIAALVVSVLGCPFVSGLVLMLINVVAPQPLAARVWQPYALLVTMIAATVFPIVAIIHIRFSRGRRTGMGMALAGLILASIWWGFALMFWLFVASFHMD